MTFSQLQKAELLNSLHLPGTPLIVTNVWDAMTAKAVAAAPGVKALATASHSVAHVRGLPDGEVISVDEAIIAARIIAGAVDLPVTVDFEKGYASDAAGVTRNVRRLIEESGAVGVNLEDSIGAARGPSSTSSPLRPAWRRPARPATPPGSRW